MKTIAPNMAVPTTKPTALVIVKMELRNNRSGRIGSVARASHKTNATSSRADATSRLMIVLDPHR